jgi:heavy metal sensor kinase
MFIKSLRGKLVAWLALMLGCILLGFGMTAYELHRTNELNQIDAELQRRVAALNATIHGPLGGEPRGGRGRSSGANNDASPDSPWRSPPPNGEPDAGHHRGPRRGFPGPHVLRLNPAVLNLFDQSETNGFYFVIWSTDARELFRSTNAPPDVPAPDPTLTATAAAVRMRGLFREAFHLTAPGERLLAGRWIGEDVHAMHQFGLWLAAAGLGVLALGVAGVWQLADRTIRPVDEMAATARRIAAGNLSERMDVARMDSELGKLGGVLNSTFAQLEAAFAQQKQFTADASHELRTPISVLITEAQTALARERTAAEYRDTVRACLDTGQEMRRLTESLLQLARLDAGQEKMQPRPIDLAILAEVCLDKIQPLIRTRAIRLERALSRADVLGDPDRLAQVMTNLLTNAVYYNVEGGLVRVITRQEDGLAIFEVIDSGQGMAAEDLPFIFDRFYRVDSARSTAAGRTGLGLAISKAIVTCHGGTIQVTSAQHSGSTFTVRLPAGQSAQIHAGT